MVRLIILLAVLILALSFFGISIRTIVESPTGHDNFTFMWELVKTGWHIVQSWFLVLSNTLHNIFPR
jgi:hypothetical protein